MWYTYSEVCLCTTDNIYYLYTTVVFCKEQYYSAMSIAVQMELVSYAAAFHMLLCSNPLQFPGVDPMSSWSYASIAQ